MYVHHAHPLHCHRCLHDLWLIKMKQNMELNAEKMRVTIIDKETGERRELPGVVGTIHVSEPEPQKQEDGRYSFNVSVKCKTRMNRKARKFIRHLARPIRAPKYIPKMYFVRLVIENYDPEQRKLTPEKLMKRTHKELVQLAVNFARMLGSPRIRVKI